MHPLFIKHGYHLFRCPSCELVKTHLGKPYDQFIEEFYTGGYYLGDETKSAFINYKEDRWYILKNMQKFLSHMKAYKNKGKLLDVGCAYGYFVELALQNGFDAYGLDPSSYAVSQVGSTIRKRVKHGTLETVSYKEKSFDVISMFDVFEHLGNPLDDLKRIRTILKDDGILTIATGNTASVSARVLKRRWTFYIPPQHLFFFNKKNITETLKQAGFVPLTFFRIGKWLSLSYVLHLAKTSGESRIASVLGKMVESFGIGSLPLYLPVGDNMVVVARKKSDLPRRQGGPIRQMP